MLDKMELCHRPIGGQYSMRKKIGEMTGKEKKINF